MHRFTPAVIPALFGSGWIVALVGWPVPAVIDWRIIGFVVVLSTAVMAGQVAPLISPDLGEWGLGTGILAALLGPLGMSITVLALFSYQSGDPAPGWERSWSVIPALAVQAVALLVVVIGLASQRKGRDPASHRFGRWLVISGTLVGATVVAAHLYAVAFGIA